MTNLKLKVNIERFSGMNDNGGIFYIDGFSVENENGVSSLDENYTVKELASVGKTGYENLMDVKTKTYIYPLTGSNLNSTTGYTLMFNGTSFFTYDDSNIFNGKIGEQTASGTYKPSAKPDLFQLPSGNILFTSSRHLGLAIRGLCKSGSGATKIVDKEGRNFTTLGLSSSDPNNKVFNLNTGQSYTITSISTTSKTNDTLNFSSGVSNSENDEFIAFAYTKWDLNKDITIPAFSGQQEQTKWSRQIKQLAIGDRYYIANGNMLAWLDGDEETLYTKFEVGENKGKLLPIGYQLVSFEVNGAVMLVSAIDSTGNGHLLLWDGYRDGWNEAINLTSAPSALYPSGSGWIFLLDSIIYFTDGYNIKPLIEYPEKGKDSMYNTTNFNAITSLNNIYYFCVASDNNSTRSLNGVLVFNPNTGLNMFKVKGNGIANRKPYCIKTKTNSSDSGSKPAIEVSGNLFYNEVQSFTPNTSNSDFKSIVYFVDFGKEVQLNIASLSIKRSSKAPLKTRDKNATIWVNYGDNTIPVLSYGKANITDTDKVANINGDKYPAVVGQEIEFTSGELAGQRTFIKSIKDGGTIEETWEVEPKLSTTGNDCEYRAWGLKSGGQKTIEVGQRVQEKFPINFIGDKLWLEIVVRGGEDAFPVSINKISLS